MIDRKYGADGTKLQEKVTTSGGSVLSRDYIGNLIYENGTLKKILFDGGYVDMTGSAPAYRFYLTDHLGSVRVVAAADGTVIQVNHYYPYGGLMIDPRHTISSTNASDSRYRFTGKELSEESGEYDYGARFLDPIPGRFTTIDPLAEKYYSLSPFAYCAGNPVNAVDVDGRIPVPNLIGAAVGAVVEYSGQIVGNYMLGKRGWDAFIDVDISDIIVAAGEGFITSGASAGKSIAKRTAIAVSSELIRNTMDFYVGDSRPSINDIDEIVVGTTVGVFFGSFEGPSSSSTIKKPL